MLEYKNMLQLKTTYIYIYILWIRFSPPGILLRSEFSMKKKKKRERRPRSRDNIGRSVARRLKSGEGGFAGGRHRLVQEDEFSNCCLFRVRREFPFRTPPCYLEIFIFTRVCHRNRRSNVSIYIYIFRWELESERNEIFIIPWRVINAPSFDHIFRSASFTQFRTAGLNRRIKSRDAIIFHFSLCIVKKIRKRKKKMPTRCIKIKVVCTSADIACSRRGHFASANFFKSSCRRCCCC